MFNLPWRMLQEHRCDNIICLYNYLESKEVYNKALARSLKFDEYKYAIAGVPFAKKWELHLNRDLVAEQALFASLGITRPYICIHQVASDFAVDIELPPAWREEYQVVEITPRGDNPFDWIWTLERANKLVLIESCFSNLVEQLDIGPKDEKYLNLKPTSAYFTPVMKNGWKFFPHLDEDEATS